MNCVDCTEAINETERKNARTCKGCNGGLHAECSMVGLDEEDLCEPCFYEQSVINEFMRTEGVEA